MFLDHFGGFIANDDERWLNDNRKIGGWQSLLKVLDVRGEISVGETSGLRRSFDRGWDWLVILTWGRVQTIDERQPRENERHQERDLNSSKHANGRWTFRCSD